MENTPQPAPTDAQPAADPTAPRHYQAPTNDGSNDNPDEFSEFRGKNASATEQYCLPGAIADPNLQRGHVEQNQHPEAIADPHQQRGHVEQNQAVAAVQASADGTPGEQKAAYALDDPRMAGGDVFDLKDEQTGF